jgi:purine nucleosidase
MTKILYDTDIGSDIDDAVCLAYLLAQPQCDLLGITTVSGEPVNRAMLASAQCKVAGKTVPIYLGAAELLMISSLQPTASQAAALSRWDHEKDFPVGEAVDFLRRTIRSHPGEVTLLATGPMTNIALLFKVDPEIPSLLKSFVMMGGVLDREKVNHLSRQGNAEWNIRCDPHAADIVYRTSVAVHRSIGLDVTTHVMMDAPQVRERFQTHRLLRPVLDFAEVWFNQSAPGYKAPDRIIFHDPLAACRT